MNVSSSTPSNKRALNLNLPPDFERNIIGLEFKIEKGEAAQDVVLQLVSMYTQAAEHYDAIDDRQTAEIYRQKIQFLFIKPQVMNIYA